MVTKKMIKSTDKRIKALQAIEEEIQEEKRAEKEGPVTHIKQYPAHLFFSYNESLGRIFFFFSFFFPFSHFCVSGPPYHVLLDTNFVNFSIQNKIDIVAGLMDCLYAKCIPYVTDCVMAELEKLGDKFRVAVRLARDPRFKRLTCTHQGTYADDCIVDRVEQHKVSLSFLFCVIFFVCLSRSFLSATLLLLATRSSNLEFAKSQAFRSCIFAPANTL